MTNWQTSLLSLALAGATSAFSTGSTTTLHRRSPSGELTSLSVACYTLASGITSSGSGHKRTSSSSSSSLRYRSIDEQDEYCTAASYNDELLQLRPLTNQDDGLSQDDDGDDRDTTATTSTSTTTSRRGISPQVLTSASTFRSASHWATRLDARFTESFEAEPQELAEKLDDSVQAISTVAYSAPHVQEVTSSSGSAEGIVEAVKAFVPVAVEIGVVVLSANHIPLN